MSRDDSQTPDAGSPLVTDISQIRATLDQLELQITEYRKYLDEQEVAVETDGEDDQSASAIATAPPVADVDVAEVASEIAIVEITEEPVAHLVEEVEEAVAPEEEPEEEYVEEEVEEGLAAPSVDLPNLFEELERQLEMGLHRTASVAIFQDGEELLSYLSSDSGSGVTPEPPPLFRAFSSGKPVAAATIWRLLDAGVLEIDAPVATYWPEFAQRGKSKVTLRHVLTHTAGLPHDYGRGDVDWGDWGRMSDILASMDLEYEPGEVIHYHAITFGLLVAEIASRAVDTDFAELFDREVRSPLRLSDTFFAVAEDDVETMDRVIRLDAAADYHDQEMPQKMDWVLANQIVSPGGTCVTSTRDLAKLYATICNGGMTNDGEVWLSEEAASQVFAIHASAYNIETMTKERVGQGVWLFDSQPNRMAAPAGSRTFGHGGMATSIAWGDPDNGLSVAIIADTMQEEELNGRRINRISSAIRRDLGLPVGSVADF